MYSFVINYAIGRYNQGHQDYLKKIFVLYQQVIADKVILNNGRIHDGTFQNVINIACRLKEFAWVRNFLESHRQYLPPEHESNAYHFNLANIFFNEKAFEKTLELLQDVQFTNAFYQNNTKLLQLKCYYELNIDFLLLSFLDSYRLFLLRSRDIPKYQKNVCSKFIKVIHKLLKLKDDKITLSKADFLQKAKKIQAEIAAPEFLVINKEWLLEKLDGLKNGI